MNEKILERVRKMLALANNAAAAEGERNNALRMAHGLLAKYNLAMADVEAFGAVEGREDHASEAFSMKWCRSIAASVAKLFFCVVYVGRQVNGTKMIYHYVGKQSNAVTASLMTEYLINSILKEARGLYKHNLAPESRAFGFGAADRLAERIAHMLEGRQTDLEGGTSLVVVELYKTEREVNEAWLKSKGITLVPFGKKGQPVKLGAYNVGRAFGDGLSLNDQLANRNRRQIGMQ